MSQSTTPKQSIDEKWKRIANNMRAEAEKLPAGHARDVLLDYAAQLEGARKLNIWLGAPGNYSNFELSRNLTAMLSDPKKAATTAEYGVNEKRSKVRDDAK